MNFKTDWSFLDKITMGAIGARTVIQELNNCGHEVVELERYSTYNKIWATKIKRLRMPDLICLKCGKRIESRAKSKLEIKMSDTETNPDRRWNVGLRDEDLVAFISCYREGEIWRSDGIVNLFEVKSLIKAEKSSKLGAPKSPGEGSERDRTWPSYTPTKSGIVTDIVKTKDKYQLKLTYDNGKTQTYSLKTTKRNYNCYCVKGDRFVENASVLAGTLSKKECNNCTSTRYDFLLDIESEIKEIRYAGVKALGYLKRTEEYVSALYNVVSGEEDLRIKLEAFSSLVRLGEDVWNDFHDFALSQEDEAYKLEFVLMLGELNENDMAIQFLYEIAKDKSNFPELRAAAVWSLRVCHENIDRIFDFALDDDEIVASHAIALLERNISIEDTDLILNKITDDVSGAVCAHILINAAIDYVQIVDKYITGSAVVKKWLLFVVGMSGKGKYYDLIMRRKEIESEELKRIQQMWDFSEFMISADVQSGIEFIKRQQL